MTIWPKNLFKAKILTQKFITSYKLDPKIYFPAEKVPSEMAHPVSQSMGVNPPPPRFDQSFFRKAADTFDIWDQIVKKRSCPGVKL